MMGASMWYGIVALLAGLVATPLAITVLRHFQVLDIPNHRSSHQYVTVRGAGFGVAVVGVTALFVASLREQPEIWVVAAAAAIFSLIGLVDDLKELSFRYRLSLQTLVALLVVVLIDLDQVFGGHGLAIAPVAVIGIVGYVNAFNFMDGINGISSLHAGAVGATWLIAGLMSGLSAPTVVGGVIVACALAFLPFNFPRARGFLGDVGSYFFGGLIAVSAVLLFVDLPLLVITLPLLPYAVDTAWTLLRRIRRGEVWHEAHREHVYQRLLGVGWSHAQSATLVGGLTLFGGMAGLLASYVAESRPAVALYVLPFVLATTGYLALPRYVDRHPRRAGAT